MSEDKTKKQQTQSGQNDKIGNNPKPMGDKQSNQADSSKKDKQDTQNDKHSQKKDQKTVYPKKADSEKTVNIDKKSGEENEGVKPGRLPDPDGEPIITDPTAPKIDPKKISQVPDPTDEPPANLT